MANAGITNATGQTFTTTLTYSWLGRADAPMVPGTIGNFNTPQTKALLAQLAYTASKWNPTLFNSTAYLAGRYQFNSSVLSQYGYLNQQFYQTHGASSMTYTVAWVGQNLITNLLQFLSNVKIQDRLAFNYMSDNYTAMVASGAIQPTDDLPTVAGMLSVAHLVGPGALPTGQNPQGTGAYQWRNFGTGGQPVNNYFNSGRYAISVLSA